MNLAEGMQSGDIIIVAAQYGMRHRGRYVQRARQCFLKNEFGLGAFAVGCMALTHPERYSRFEELDTDCAGDNFSMFGSSHDNHYDTAPVFRFTEDELQLSMYHESLYDDKYGSVTAFIPITKK